MDFRTVDRDLWNHRVMRRASERAGRLFLYLVTGAADCEGRFDADPFALLDGCWSAVHGVSIEDVKAALDELADAGVVLLYSAGGGAFGFLPGWYEHQRVDQKYRDGSSIPAPPILLASWATIDEVRTFYADYADLRGTNVSRRAAITWFLALPEEEQTRLLGPQVALRGNGPECALSSHKVQQEGKGKGRGKEEEGSGKVRTSPAKTTFEDYGPAPLSDRETLTRRCCDILAPIAGKADACIVTVENVMASHVKAPDYILTACMELRARYEAGDRVHLSYLPRNVLDLIERDEARKSGSGAPPAGSGKYRGPGDPDKQPSSWEEALGRG